MASSYGTITVPATSNGVLVVAANKRRTGLLILNNSSVAMFFGSNNSVTVANGYPLAAGAEREWKLDGLPWADRDGAFYTGAIYGIVASGTENLRYWEFDDVGDI